MSSPSLVGGARTTSPNVPLIPPTNSLGRRTPWLTPRLSASQDSSVRRGSRISTTDGTPPGGGAA